MIEVRGIPTGRGYLIEEAIRRIQADPDNALKTEYLGIKNYAHFGDQRSDHSYCMGPTHGSIVFSIGRQRSGAPIDPEADIQELLRVRDFGGQEIPKTVIDLLYRDSRGAKWNYQQAKKDAQRLVAALRDIEAQLASVQEVTP